MSQHWPLADVLSITTSHLLSRRTMAGVTDLLSWMTGERLRRWQLPRAADAASTALTAQHPWLVDLSASAPPSGTAPADLYAWLVEAERVHGSELPVDPLTDWMRQDPVQELVDRVELAKLPTVEGS